MKMTLFRKGIAVFLSVLMVFTLFPNVAMAGEFDTENDVDEVTLIEQEEPEIQDVVVDEEQEELEMQDIIVDEEQEEPEIQDIYVEEEQEEPQNIEEEQIVASESELYELSVFSDKEDVEITAEETLSAIVASGICGLNVNWTLDNEGTMTICGSGATSDISYSGSNGEAWDDIKKNVITIKVEAGVTSIAENMFKGCSMVESVELPENLVAVGQRAFWGCTRLADINLPEGINEISEGVFYECKSLKEIILPSSIKRIGEHAFAHCWELTDVTIPEGVTDIEYYAFGGCSKLSSVNIPSSVKTLDPQAFDYTTKLFIDANSEAASCLAYKESGDTISGAFYSPNAPEYEIHKVERDDGSYYLSVGDYTGGEERITLPTEIDGIQVLKVEGYAFQDAQQLTEVVIPDGYERIGYLAFYTNQMLKKVYVPATVTYINQAFDYKPTIQCHKGSYAEQWATDNGCAVEYVNDIAIVVPKTLFIREGMVKQIEANIFGNYENEPIKWETSNPDIVTVTEDGKATAVSNGKAVVTLTVGHVKKNIEINVYSLETVYSGICGENVNWTLDNEGTMMISGNGATSAISYSGSNGETWDDIKKNVITVKVEAGVTSIAENMFKGCSMVESVELPENLVAVGQRAFWGCTRLADINLPEGINEISEGVFYECKSLKEIILPSSIKRIGEHAFAHCWELTDVTIPEGVTDIEYYAFGGCSKLSSVNIPSSVKTLDPQAFDYTTKLFIDANSEAASCLAYKESGDTISGAFYSPNAPEYEIHKVERDDGSYYLSVGDYTGGEERITLPTEIDGIQVLKVEGYAFQDAQQLTEVVIPDGYERIGYLAFYTNQMLKKVYVPATVTYIVDSAFEHKPTIQCYKGSYAEQWATDNGCSVEHADDINPLYYAHTPLEAVKENEMKATCTKEGSYDSVVYCSVCNEEISRESKTEEATGHSFGEWIQITSPTCTDKGIEKRICTVCEFSDTRDIAAKGHSWETTYTVDKEPTCTEEGSKSIHCKNCDTIKDSTVIEVKGHTPLEAVKENEVKATCTKEGSYDSVVYCSVCSEEISRESKTEEATGHSFGEWIQITSPTCTDKGIEKRTCTVCEFSDTRDIAAKGHSWETTYTVDKEPTCTEEGRKSIHCKNCNSTKNNISISCVAHVYKDITTKATLTTNGKIAKKCKLCGRIASNIIIYYPKSIVLDRISSTYSGKVQKPRISIKDAAGKTINSSNYSVSYSKGYKNVGIYIIKISFKGNYSGIVSKTFTIIPKGTSLSKLAAASKGFSATWKKQTTQTTGYQIQYSTNSKFKNTKTVTISKNSTVKKKITRLSGEKKYYVRIRTYRTVSGKKIYSIWSSTKTVKTKK